MRTRLLRWDPRGFTANAPVKIVPLLLAAMTVAAGAIILLSFQRWVDFGIAETNGIDAEAATGTSDGGFVALLGAAVLLLIGGAVFRPGYRPALLPLIALASASILAIAGFDAVTSWHATGFHPDNAGILVHSHGDPTVAPYMIASLAIVIDVLAAAVRAIEMLDNPHLLGDLVEYEQSAPEALSDD